MQPGGPDYCFHLHWLREAAGGGWIRPIGQVVPARNPRHLAGAIAALAGWPEPTPAIEALGLQIFAEAGESGRSIELHLPPLDRKRLREGAAALATPTVQNVEERIAVSLTDAGGAEIAHNEMQASLTVAAAIRGAVDLDFQLRFHDRRTTTAAHLGYAGDGDVEVARTVSIPGSLAVMWNQAPFERQPGNLRVYGQLSRGIQLALRRWLPYLYFSEPSRFEDCETAWPLLVYQATEPFVGKTRSALTYDVLEDASLARCFRTASGRLPGLLARAARILRSAGMEDAAKLYAARRSAQVIAHVQRARKLFLGLLSAEAAFVDSHIRFGLALRDLCEKAGADPKKASRDGSRLAADFVRATHTRIRRLYNHTEFFPLGSLLLLESTLAVSGSPVAAAETLRIDGQLIDGANHSVIGFVS